MSRTMTAELREALGRVVDDLSFSGSHVHGNAGWTSAGLAAVAIVWVWHGLGGLVVRYEQARRVLAELRPGERPPGTYQGFVQPGSPASPIRTGRVASATGCRRHPLADF